MSTCIECSHPDHPPGRCGWVAEDRKSICLCPSPDKKVPVLNTKPVCDECGGDGKCGCDECGCTDPCSGCSGVAQEAK